MSSGRIKHIIFPVFGVALFLIPGLQIINYGIGLFYDRPSKVSPVKPSIVEMVPMREGISLATDIYKPSDGKAPWPTILIRTRYNRALRSPERYLGGLPERLIKSGYVYVIQDVQGRYGS
jgi:predicted acyl esterase